MKRRTEADHQARVDRGVSPPAAASRLTVAMAAVITFAAACNETPTGGYVPPQDFGNGRDASAPTDAGASNKIIEPGDTAGLAVLLRDGQLSGWIHGAVHDRGLYVFTYRKPGDFFSFAEFPLAPATPEVATRLQQLKRHDELLIKGAFIQNMAPIRHIRLVDFSVVTPYESDEALPSRTSETSFPAELIGMTEAVGKVHAVDADGRILVIEYGDAVVPVYVRVPSLTAGLYRNDKIRLAFEFAVVPARPTHLWLDTAAAKPLEVMERLQERHGQPFEADGSLVRYPKSPEITIDVYALQVVDADGISRDFTLLNNSSSIFTAIHDKLSAAWKSRPGRAINGRNKLVNPSIRVHAKGTFNLVAPNQANAQILLDSADDVSVTLMP
ncbi:MAG: hypothetical protein ABUS79_07500 [Pseudomonadota bacterium]